MARAFWKGSLSLGLVEIPVRLRSAVRPQSLGFTFLDRKDFAPVGNGHYNKNTGREVPWERIVRGYEYEPDEYVVLSDEELRRANVEATQTIEIIEFVDVCEIDPIFFDTAYYVEPLKRAARATHCCARRSSARARPASRASSCARASTWRRCTRAIPCWC